MEKKTEKKNTTQTPTLVGEFTILGETSQINNTVVVH